MKIAIVQSATLAELFTRTNVPTTVNDAIDYLKKHVSAVRLLSLYRHYFPKEYEQSKASRKAAEDKPYSDIELEFFRLVDKHLFPLSEDHLEYIMEDWVAEWAITDGRRPDPRDNEIPTYPLGLSDWEEGCRSYFRPGWQLLMWTICEEQYPSGDDVELPHDLWEAASKIGLWDETGTGVDRLNEATLAQLLAKVPRKHSALKGLPQALDMLRRDTGLWYLDAYHDQSVGPWINTYWTREDMDRLIEEYAAAKKYVAGVHALLDWMEADTANMWRVLSVLQRSVEGESKPARGRTRVRAA